jgi:serine/threonine protein kinase
MKMKDPNRLCLGCMNEWGHPGQPCPVCGFVQNTYERPPRWLPLKHILNGKYMLGKVIGEGGFGITYIGWDLNLQVRVAIKEYFPVGLATRETGRGSGHTITALPGVRQENYRQGLEKFMTEAKNLSKFYNLKGIVAVKDFFFENDTAYMVMEFVDGITLGKYLKDHGGQISEQEVLQLFHPVMESLKVVHQSGIIHRDISPDNIMMTKDGRMKLIDFGAARFAGGDTERSLTIILKHGYAPAEQYQSHGNQGPWTDVYAICATMYRMITGKVPPSAMDRLHQDTIEEFEHLGCRVSVKTAYAVIDKGLAIRVEDRYRDMDELIQGLYGMDNKKVQRKKKSSDKKAAIGVAAIAGVLCLGIGGILLAVGSRKNLICTASRDFGRQYILRIWKYLLSKPHEVAVHNKKHALLTVVLKQEFSEPTVEKAKCFLKHCNFYHFL